MIPNEQLREHFMAQVAQNLEQHTPTSIAERAYDLIGSTPRSQVWNDIVAGQFRDRIDWSKPPTERERQIFHFTDGSTLHYDERHHVWAWMAPAPDGMRASAVLVTDQGVRAGAHPRFLDLLDRMREMHIRKGLDYGDVDEHGVNRLGNMRRSERIGVPAHMAAAVRLSDKWARFEQLYNRQQRNQGGPAVADESMLDTLMDLASYALLCRVLLEEAQAPPQS